MNFLNILVRVPAPTSEVHCSGQGPGSQGLNYLHIFVLIQSGRLSFNNNEQPNIILPSSLNSYKNLLGIIITPNLRMKDLRILRGKLA